jgi:hypothetical protein
VFHLLDYLLDYNWNALAPEFTIAESRELGLVVDHNGLFKRAI